MEHNPENCFYDGFMAQENLTWNSKGVYYVIYQTLSQEEGYVARYCGVR